eukprot:GHVR01058004.1.p1 GENE.GHVR01058004.1~~GHVR01058004.1.p1  ORF type:complete len:229 (+),score=53.67 GHVR01058004.1:175-861(+)
MLSMSQQLAHAREVARLKHTVRRIDGRKETGEFRLKGMTKEETEIFLENSHNEKNSKKKEQRVIKIGENKEININSKPIANRHRERWTVANTIGQIRQRELSPVYIGKLSVDFTNEYRGKKDLHSLIWSDALMVIAEMHSRDMALGVVPFGHDGVKKRFAAFPFTSRRSAENVALNKGSYDVARVAVDGWIKSPGHEKNLIGCFSVCAVGVATASDGTYYLTQLFGSH